MSLLPDTPKTFNLLSIGQRGVGKTVFLAGSYAELHSYNQPEHKRQLWFDCQDSQEQEKIEQLLKYITRTGQYPPPTLKITNFKFSMKFHSQRGTKTLCHFGWWDIPGESCNIDNPDFQKMVFNSSGCCVFIDAHALVHQPTYQQAFEEIIQQLMPIATLVHLNCFSYAFALILTKCDLLEADPLSRQHLEQRLQPLTSRLDAVKANYQTFHSDIPIIHSEGVSTLEATGAAAPLLWLVWELNKAHNPGLMNALVSRLRSNSQQQVAPSLQSIFTSAGTSRVRKILGLYLFPSTRRYILLLAMAIVGVLGVFSLFSVNYERIFQRQPKNLDTLVDVETLRQRGQFDQAVPLMEKLVQQDPKSVNLGLQLADLYEITGQPMKAETAYDQVLAQQNNNLKALISKAKLRYASGDIKTASALFAQAEKAAPEDLKAQVHALAQKTLGSPAQLLSPAQ